MAYNPYFQTNYQYYQQPQQNNGIIWVQGEAGAKSYLVAPNNTVQLWDSESQTIYLKSADASGMPSMRILDYTIRDMAPKMPNKTVLDTGADYPSRKEFEALKRQIEALKKELGVKEDNDDSV